MLAVHFLLANEFQSKFSHALPVHPPEELVDRSGAAAKFPAVDNASKLDVTPPEGGGGRKMSARC